MLDPEKINKCDKFKLQVSETCSRLSKNIQNVNEDIIQELNIFCLHEKINESQQNYYEHISRMPAEPNSAETIIQKQEGK
jgi:hypothetical protein